MNGGIYNAALFNASQREARNKLEKMAGIQRPGPSGILASSPELMQAAMPAPRAMTPQQPVPAPRPMVQPALPQVPMPTMVTPVQQPVQQAPAPAAQQQPVMMQEGGDVKLNRQNPKAVRESITSGIDVGLDPMQFQKNLIAHYGSMEKATEVVEKKVADLEGTIEKTNDPAKISDAVLRAAGEDATDASKRDFARNVFGLQDVNDIDEINRRIADVAIGSSVGKGVDAYAEAVMLGLQTYKQTAAARAAAAAGGGEGEKARQEFLYNDVFRKTYEAALEIDPNNPQAALAAAAAAARQAAPGAPSAIRGGGGAATPAAQPADSSGLPMVTSQEEFDALPSGAYFIQNGQRRKKP